MADMEFDPARDIPSLAGKTILITGANSGLGKQSALELARHGPAQVWMAVRDLAKGQQAVDDIKKQVPDANLTLVQMDLGSFASVKAAAQTVRKTTPKLDILMLNAGILGCPPKLTPEGYEVQMGTNHLGHILLLKLLMPILTPDARVVSLSSSAWKYAGPEKIQFETLRTADAGVLAMSRYIQSKVANLLYARASAKHNPDLMIVSINPGEVKTQLFSREPGDEHARNLLKEFVPKVVGSVAEGVKTQVWAATTAATSLVNGSHYAPVCKEEVWGLAADDELAEIVWQWTEKELEGHY